MSLELLSVGIIGIAVVGFVAYFIGLLNPNRTNNAPSKQVYYHYTTSEAAEAIIKSRLLIRSDSKRSGDAVYGPGVYLTKMPPSAGKCEIALNSWDGGRGFADQIIRSGKVSAVICLELDPRSIRDVHDPSGRDIYLYPGDLQIASDMKARGYLI